ncbi:MAG: ABC transporter permease, partial [Gammaproteobacteria bacterium]|nr:ABC transporter permease [Gammaproteobacteria bacterium]
MATITTVELILLTVVSAATPLLLAATGELVVEKSGILNLGVEGMMLVGAVSAFIAMLTTGSWALGIVAGAAAGVIMSMLFGVLTLFFLANQVASGLALTLFGIGISSLLGIPFIGLPIEKLPALDIPVLGDIPILGPLLFKQDFLIYFSVLMVVVVHFFLFRTRAGLILRAVGESHDAAHSIGYSVIRIRFFAVMFGGAMAGLGGAFLSLSYTPMWVE